MWPEIISVAIPLVLLAFGFSIGRFQERRHLASLAVREAELADIRVTNLRHITTPETVEYAAFVNGQAVIATDYFKAVLAGFRNVVGGEVRSYVTLMGRARREALVRMLEEARALGASEVWNVRFGTSNVRSSAGGRNKASVSVEVFAYGTAIVRK